MFLERVVNALNVHGVKYALVGGYAVALHGAVRGTLDIDVAIQLAPAAFTKTEAALISLGLVSRLPVGAADVFKFRKEYINNRNLIAWSFVNPDRPVEVVDVIITEDAGKLKTVTKTVGKLKIKVAAIEDLIRIKRKAGRPQDFEDIKALEKLR
jgi:hypothetical protein